MLVLKIIGIVLLSILALILLLLLLVLFVPIRYEATAFADGTDLQKLKAKATVHWLLHLVSIGAAFEEKQFKLSGRIAFYKLFGEEKEKEEKPVKKKKEKKPEVKETPTEEEPARGPEPVKEPESVKEPEPEVEENVKEPEPTPETSDTEIAESEKTEESVKETASSKEPKKKAKKKKEKKPKKEKKKKEKKQKNPNSLPNRLKRLYKKRDKVERVYEKEKANLQVAIRRTGRILKKILPRKCKGYVEFGLSDPATTGKILGYVSALYAMTGPVVNLYPDFTEQKLKADVKLTGHFTLFSVGIYVLQVPLNKELRRAYRYLKKLSLEEDK